MAYGDKTNSPFSLSTISGCTDPDALNYNKNATKDDGSCTYASITNPIYGCMDPAASNYNKNATDDDGSCVYDNEDDNNLLTGTVLMISGDNRIWKMISYNNSGLFGYVEPGMTGTLSDPPRGYFENKTIQKLDLSTAMITLTSGVSGAQHGDELNFSLDTSQQVHDVEDDEEDTGGTRNPVVEVNLNATLEDGWYFANPQMDYLLPDLNNPYVGSYHLMEDGTYMIGEGVPDEEHEINPDDIILQDYSDAETSDYIPDDTEEEMPVADYETIQEVREIVSDLFYKLWFVENTLSDEQVLSLQTTIRGGKKVTGRTEDEPLVFYKKDRNTLENRRDLQGDEFEAICQDIFNHEIPNDFISGMFEIYEPPEEPYVNRKEITQVNHYWKLQKYIIQYTNGFTTHDVVIAEEVILYHDTIGEDDDTDVEGVY